MVWIWAVVFLVTLIVEIITVELASIWFSFGSLIAFILALCGVNETIQIIVFIVASVLMFLSFRNICMKLLKNSKEKTNADSLVGTVHKLTKEIKEDEPGEIKINDIPWRVISKTNEKIERGNEVRILEVQGNKFIVEKVASFNNSDNNTSENNSNEKNNLAENETASESVKEGLTK